MSRLGKPSQLPDLKRGMKEKDSGVIALSLSVGVLIGSVLSDKSQFSINLGSDCVFPDGSSTHQLIQELYPQAICFAPIPKSPEIEMSEIAKTNEMELWHDILGLIDADVPLYKDSKYEIWKAKGNNIGVVLELSTNTIRLVKMKAPGDRYYQIIKEARFIKNIP